MLTVHTAPHGTADVVAHGRWYRVRVRKADGGWIMLGTLYTSSDKAREAANEVDRWDPDGSGRFPAI